MEFPGSIGEFWNGIIRNLLLTKPLIMTIEIEIYTI